MMVRSMDLGNICNTQKGGKGKGYIVTYMKEEKERWYHYNSRIKMVKFLKDLRKKRKKFKVIICWNGKQLTKEEINNLIDTIKVKKKKVLFLDT